MRRPRLVRARLGVEMDQLTRGEAMDVVVRVVSGSVLSGREARRPVNYLGRFHTQVSVVAEARRGDVGSSAGDGGHVFSTYRPAVPGRRRQRRFTFTTALHGRPTAMVPLGGFARVMPLDILPTQLLRALLVGDTDMARALGCLELDEEDLALRIFACPSKLDYGLSLREALESIEKER